MDQLKMFQYGFEKAELRSHSHHHRSSSSSSISSGAAIALCNEMRNNMLQASVNLINQAGTINMAVGAINCGFAN